ncbi:MAG: hypothetical protein RSA97_03100 [Oscillospiraceae bacterium]
MQNAGLIIVCCIPVVVGVCTIFYALVELTVLAPLREAILIVPIFDENIPVSEMLRVIKCSSYGQTTIVADMHGTICNRKRLVELGLCDEVIGPDGVSGILQKRFDESGLKISAQP